MKWTTFVSRYITTYVFAVVQEEDGQQPIADTTAAAEPDGHVPSPTVPDTATAAANDDVS